MKVIKEGTAHLVDIICDRCHSELQYESKDVICSESIEEMTRYIWCPVCRHSIVIDKVSIERPESKPKKWWQRFMMGYQCK